VYGTQLKPVISFMLATVRDPNQDAISEQSFVRPLFRGRVKMFDMLNGIVLGFKNGSAITKIFI